MLKVGVKEWHSPCQQEDYRITTWAVSGREAVHHVVVKDNIRLMLNSTKPPRAPVAELWCTCPWGVSGSDSPCHLLVSKTSSANKILLRSGKQLGSAWEHLAAVFRVHKAPAIWLVLGLQQEQLYLFGFLFPTPCSAAFAFAGKSCFLSVKKRAKVYSVKWFFSPLSPFRGDWQDLQVSHYVSSCFQRLQTPRLLKINELDTVKAQEFLASSRTTQYIMAFKRKEPTQVYTILLRITASLHFGGLKFWVTWQCVCLH